MTQAIPDRVVLKGGTIAPGPDEPARVADVAVAGGRIVDAGLVAVGRGDHVIDCSGRTVMPGFIDAHCHADGMIFEPDVQLALLRQGVTTVITGQDGVGFAAGSGRYASEYFGVLNGHHPDYDGGGVAGYWPATTAGSG